MVFMMSISILVGQKTNQIDSVSKIQLCLLLDVSGSMDGLISQAQNEIWKTISFLEGFEKDSLETVIEIAVISYGNIDHIETDHVNVISDFTDDIDVIAKALWLMKTGGSFEFCGSAIKNAMDSLSWAKENLFKCMIIAGNEPFDQGEIKFEESIKLAKENGVKLNTIYCGDRERGVYENWERASELGNGIFAHIDQQISSDEFKTPYDQSLIQFYYDYKSTFIDEDFGEEKLNQFDDKGEISPAFRDMIIYKFGRIKKEKDLIDKFEDSNWELDKFNASEIPSPWQNLDKRKLKFKLLEYSRMRNLYREGFEAFTQKVEDFLRITVQPKLSDKTLNLAMKEMILQQLIEYGYKEMK